MSAREARLLPFATFRRAKALRHIEVRAKSETPIEHERCDGARGELHQIAGLC